MKLFNAIAATTVFGTSLIFVGSASAHPPAPIGHHLKLCRYQEWAGGCNLSSDVHMTPLPMGSDGRPVRHWHSDGDYHHVH